jgi:alpha-galactosidase
MHSDDEGRSMANGARTLGQRLLEELVNRGLVVCLTLFSFLLPVSCLHAQSLAGKWAVNNLTLDNGEVDKIVLELNQSGTELTGTVKTLGFSADVKGTAHGLHFQLFVPWEDKSPFLVGELKGNELHAMKGDRLLVAKPSGPGDELPPLPPYIEPAPLQRVPYNRMTKTPPMGWNSWNMFAGRIDDKTVREIADAMVSSGMRDAGYVYVNIDDTWEGVRDAHGNLQSNHKFPDMKALADYVHSKGLMLGVYSSPGPRTCAGYPGSYGYEQQDARTFADWGIDYLKYDWCTASTIYKNDQLQAVYQRMGQALQAAGRPIVFSLCEYGMNGVEKWGPDVDGNLWRTTGDIRDEWSSMIGNVEKQVSAAAYAGPGHWNDPDMLEIGNGHMSNDEYRTHMSLWALVAAPLLAGNDIRNMTPATKDILMNEEVIAVDQDPLGKQASPLRNSDLEIWIKPLADGSIAVGIVNMGSAAAIATVKAAELGLHGEIKEARDLWTHKEVTFTKNEYSASIPGHGTLLMKVSSESVSQ